MKKENRLLTIDGETLMSQPLTPLNFVVDTLLSQGLHILAGSPKVGKSWLALWLAVTVAKGEAVSVSYTHLNIVVCIAGVDDV